MNKNVKMAIGITVAIIIILGCGFFIKSMAEASARRTEGEKVLATVNGEKITQREFDLLKENVKLGDMTMGDKEILSRMAMNKVLYLDALKNGGKTTDKNVQDLVSAEKDRYVKNGKYAALKKDLRKMHITEKEYWDNETKRIKESEIKRAYRNELKKEYAKDNEIKDMNALNTKFAEYYNEYTGEVMTNSEIKFLVDLK